jgi:hypothetical protein
MNDMIADPPASAKLTRGEIRYLYRSFIVLWVVLLIAVLIFGLFVMRPQLRGGPDTLLRTRSYPRRGAPIRWPSSTPRSMRWPEPDKAATFDSPASFADAILATAWDADSTNYVMEVIRTGAPWTIVEIKKTSVVQHGQVLHRSPPVGKEPSLRIRPIGIMLNAGLYALGAWFFIGFLPVADRQSTRRQRHKAWVKSEMCGVCGYDILDLPICPECGTPSHRAASTPTAPDP